MKKILLSILVLGLLIFGCTGQGGTGSGTLGTGGGGVASLASCTSNCQSSGLPERTQIVCIAGCHMDEAKRARSDQTCDQFFDRYPQERVYYQGCLDVAAGAMNSISPCNKISEGARRNTCVEAAAADAHNPALCDQMRQVDTSPDPDLQAAYERTFGQSQSECRTDAG